MGGRAVTAGIPAAVSSYAAYLQARTGLATKVAVSGKAATISASRDGSELCITFGPASGKLDCRITRA